MSEKVDLVLLSRIDRERDLRNHRLLGSASLRVVLGTLPDGPIAEVVRASAEFAEWWVYAELEDAGLGERTQLIRSYDRRQLRNPIVAKIESVRSSEFPGTPTTRRLVEYAALGAASQLIADVYYWENWNSQQALNLALAAPRGSADTSQSDAVRRTLTDDIFGPDRLIEFSRDWRTDTAIALARTMYEAREFSAMPILADALQDAGCDNDDILSHCRDPKQVHVRGCWVVDLVLGKT
jgi:hypothetical protein